MSEWGTADSETTSRSELNGRGQPGSWSTRNRNLFIIAAVALIACLVVVTLLVRAKLDSVDATRALACEIEPGRRVLTPPAVLEKFAVSQNSANYVEFTATFDPAVEQHAVPNKGTIDQPRTNLQVFMGKGGEAIETSENNYPNSDGTYEVAVALEDRFELTVWDEGNSPAAEITKINVTQRGPEVVIGLDPSELPDLDAGEAFDVWAGASYDATLWGFDSRYNAVFCR